MFIVTGGAGFIGSQLIKSLNQQGYTDILVVDDLSDGSKFTRLVDLTITDYMDKSEFITQIVSGQDFGSIQGVLHFGANTSLSESNGKLMMENNYEYSKDLLHYCIERDIPFIYASDAAVYGDSKVTTEQRENEKPTTLYAYTKFQFDQYVRGVMLDAEEHNEALPQIVGVRYTEISELPNQLSIDEVCKLNNWLIEHSEVSGIYNFGTIGAINMDKLIQLGYSF